jgi:hypothetical protein
MLILRPCGVQAGPNRDIGKQGSSSVDRAALLRVAAGTPLPDAKSADEGQARPEHRYSEGNTQQRLSQPAVYATTSRRSTLLRGVIAVVAAVVLALVVPYCNDCDYPVLARSLPELAANAAAASYSELRVQALAVTDAVKAHWNSVVS